MPIDIETPSVMRAVRIKARKLKTYVCFLDKDFEDIEADLFGHLWKTGLTLPPGRSVDVPFIHTILNRKGVDMLRRQMSLKEVARRDTESLDAMFVADEDGNPQTSADTLPSRTPSLIDEVSFHIDFADRLSALSSELRIIAGSMLQGLSHADIAREMHMSRDAFHRKYAVPIQKALFPKQYVKIKKIGPMLGAHEMP